MQVFKNDPYVFVWKAFKSLYPDKECSVYFDDEMDLSEDGQPVYGFTNFPLDESDGIVVCISSDISVSDSVEVLAHELAHVAVGESVEHGKEWEDAFDKIHKNIMRLERSYFDMNNNTDLQGILKTEYSERFDELRKKMMIMSYYKYGKMSTNYKSEKCINAIGSLEKRLQAYKETGNTEFLADIANFAMIEFMFPQHDKAHYKPTDSGSCEIDGFGINEIRNFEG